MDAQELLERYEAGERSFAGAHLEGAELVQAELSRIDLSRATLSLAKLVAAELDGARLVGADLVGADLRDANLQAADLQNAHLRGARLQHADLREALAMHAMMQHVDLHHADLRGVDLRGADLEHAVLARADLQYADLRGANLRSADLRGADLRSARMKAAVLTGATIDAETLRVTGWTPGQLSEVIALGAEVLESSEMATEFRRAITGLNLGLSLYFDTEVAPLDALRLQAAILAVLGPDTGCRVVEHAEMASGVLVRLESADQGELATLGDALADRIWESPALERERAAMPFADLLPRADRTALSLLVDRAVCFELYRSPGEGSRPTLDRTWTPDRTAERRLGTLLGAVLGTVDLRQWLARLPGGPDLVAALPGPEASATAAGRAAAKALSARSLVDGDLFAGLVGLRPERRRDIGFVADAWAIELPPPPRRDKYDFR